MTLELETLFNRDYVPLLNGFKSTYSFDGNNIDGAVPAAVIPKWPLKPGVLVHVNNNHSLNARRLQNASNNNVNAAGNQTQNQFYGAVEKRSKRGETLNHIGIESQRSRAHRIKRMLFTEQLKYKNDTLPGVFHGKSGGKASLLYCNRLYSRTRHIVLTYVKFE